MRAWRRSQRRGIPARALAVPVALLVFAIASAFAWFGTPSAPLSGRAFIVDGDTIRLGQTRVRLTGIDAPELDQDCTKPTGEHWACGETAKDFLVSLAGGKTVDCRRTGRDHYARWLASCTVGTADIAAEITRAGWAVADFTYLKEQADAQADKRGIWSGPFTSPEDWRRTHGEPTPSILDWLRAWFQ